MRFHAECQTIILLPLRVLRQDGLDQFVGENEVHILIGMIEFIREEVGHVDAALRQLLPNGIAVGHGDALCARGLLRRRDVLVHESARHALFEIGGELSRGIVRDEGTDLVVHRIRRHVDTFRARCLDLAEDLGQISLKVPNAALAVIGVVEPKAYHDEVGRIGEDALLQAIDAAAGAAPADPRVDDGERDGRVELLKHCFELFHIAPFGMKLRLERSALYFVAVETALRDAVAEKDEGDGSPFGGVALLLLYFFKDLHTHISVSHYTLSSEPCQSHRRPLGKNRLSKSDGEIII